MTLSKIATFVIGAILGFVGLLVTVSSATKVKTVEDLLPLAVGLILLVLGVYILSGKEIHVS